MGVVLPEKCGWPRGISRKFPRTCLRLGLPPGREILALPNLGASAYAVSSMQLKGSYTTFDSIYQRLAGSIPPRNDAFAHSVVYIYFSLPHP